MVVNNKVVVAEIIAIACEIVGEKNSNTIDICKHMLIDNVIYMG